MDTSRFRVRAVDTWAFDSVTSGRTAHSVATFVFMLIFACPTASHAQDLGNRSLVTTNGLSAGGSQSVGEKTDYAALLSELPPLPAGIFDDMPEAAPAAAAKTASVPRNAGGPGPVQSDTRVGPNRADAKACSIRVWKSMSGHEVRGEYYGRTLSGSMVTHIRLRLEDGTMVSVGLRDLSGEDCEYLISIGVVGRDDPNMTTAQGRIPWGMGAMKQWRDRDAAQSRRVDLETKGREGLREELQVIEARLAEIMAATIITTYRGEVSDLGTVTLRPYAYDNRTNLQRSECKKLERRAAEIRETLGMAPRK